MSTAPKARYLAVNMVTVVVNSRNRDKLNKCLHALR